MQSEKQSLRNYVIKTSKISFATTYGIILFYIVFLARRRRNIIFRDLNLVPLRRTISAWQEISYYDEASRINFYSNLYGNIALFIPIPFILISIFKFQRKITVIVAAFLISVLIEIVQFIFKLGVADIDDVILNTLGACIGLLGYFILQKIQTRYKQAA